MENKDIKTTSVTDINSMNETIWIDHNEVYKAQYRHLSKSHSDILKYHFAKYPTADADIYEFLKNDKNNLIDMCYTYSAEDKASINSISRIYFLENTLKNEILIKEESLNIQTLKTGTITKYAYNKKGDMTYLFEYFPNGKLLHIINFSNSEDDLMDFDNPLERIDWSQVAFLENPKEYYANGLN